MNIKIHGDIILTPSKKENGEIIKHNGSFVLARGEVTNHSHILTVPYITDMEVVKLPDGRIQLTVKKTATVTHEEHKTLEVPAGTYIVGNEREYSYFENHARKVID